MLNKKGIISISIVYSFFMIFIILIIALLVNYSNNRIMVKKIHTEIKNSLPSVPLQDPIDAPPEVAP